MSILARKEFRLLLPAWIAALAAATMPLWVGRNFLQIAVLCFGLTALLLGLTPFGQEMSCGTFGLLLSQPEKRGRFWNIKTGLLQGALVSAWAVFALCWWIDSRHPDPWQTNIFGSFADMAFATGLLALLAFSGGLWSTLLLRELTTAFFATALVPLVIFLISSGTVVGLDIFPGHQPGIIALPLIIYVVAGFYFARRLFLRAQDVAWSGGQISPVAWRGGLFRWLAFGFREKRGPWSALIWKELQLQEVTITIVPLLLALHLAALAARHFAPDWSARIYVFDFAGFLWLVAPFVVGCVAVAEERRQNTLEGFLCLPARKRSQLLVKFAVAMALGTVLGGVVPGVLESIAGGNSRWLPSDSQLIFPLWAAAVAAISFFASTMSRGMLQAFTVALLFPIPVGVFYAVLLDHFKFCANVYLYGGLLLPVFLWPALIAAYFWMAFRNYKRLQTGWALRAGNLARFVVVIASVSVVAGTIYNRSWEYFMDLEPRHGPARLSGPGRAVIGGLVEAKDHWMDGLDYYALLPDGRLWAGKTGPIQPDRAIGNLSGHFAEGSNWVDLAVTQSSGAAALKSDGTLWKFPLQGDPSQIGSASDWKKVVSGADWFLALKQDGTIWGWGTDSCGILFNHPDEKGRGLTAPDPFQVWQESDWADVHALDTSQAVAVKRDGSLWKWGAGAGLRWNNYADYHQLVRADNMGGGNWSSLAANSFDSLMGVRSDGSLWAAFSERFLWRGGYSQDLSLFGTRIPPDQAGGPKGGFGRLGRIGTNLDWAGVSVGGMQYLALKADGAFWAIDTDWFQSKQPSRYHDWLAASGNYMMNWTLAKDGTISCWNGFFIEYPYGFYNGSYHPVVALRPSRRPLAGINILDAK
jgi:hypothetical protein